MCRHSRGAKSGLPPAYCVLRCSLKTSVNESGGRPRGSPPEPSLPTPSPAPAGAPGNVVRREGTRRELRRSGEGPVVGQEVVCVVDLLAVDLELVLERRGRAIDRVAAVVRLQLPVSAWRSMPQRFGFDAKPGLHALYGAAASVPPVIGLRFALGSELSTMRSIEPEVSTSRRTLGSGRAVVPAICAFASPDAQSAPSAVAPRTARSTTRDIPIRELLRSFGMIPPQ